MPSHVAVLTKQMLVYKHHRVIPKIESVAKTPKLNPRINLGILPDLRIYLIRGLSFVSKSGRKTHKPKITIIITTKT